MAPKQPDGGWDPSQGGATTTTSGSARTTLWDLNGLNEKVPITIKYGVPHRTIPGRLDPYDRETAQSAQTKAETSALGLPADLVKRPIMLYGSDPKAYLAFQQALYAGGFYGSTPPQSIPWGTDPSGTTYDAWKRVLAAAQQAQAAGINLTPDQVLEQGIKAHTDATKGVGVPKNPLILQTTDPATLAGLVQRAAQDSLGRNLSKDEVDSFIRSFHEQEVAFSKKRYAAGEDTTGGTHTLTAPDATAQAEQFVEGGHKTESEGNRAADFIGVLHQMLGG